MVINEESTGLKTTEWGYHGDIMGDDWNIFHEKTPRVALQRGDHHRDLILI